MTGFIYFVRRGDFGSVKVGYSVDVPKRVTALQTGSDVPLVLLGQVRGNKAQEAEVHRVLGPYRKSGEWFQDSPFMAEFIAAAVAFGVEEAIHLGEAHVKPGDWSHYFKPKRRYMNGRRPDILNDMQEAIDNT